MKKIEPLPFQTLYQKNDNMYQNVVIVSERAKSIISENVIDLSNKEEGFDSTEEILESETQDLIKLKLSLQQRMSLFKMSSIGIKKKTKF